MYVSACIYKGINFVYLVKYNLDEYIHYLMPLFHWQNASNTGNFLVQLRSKMKISINWSQTDGSFSTFLSLYLRLSRCIFLFFSCLCSNNSTVKTQYLQKFNFEISKFLEDQLYITYILRHCHNIIHWPYIEITLSIYAHHLMLIFM